jgi:lipopolysaccharide transport system permease protein
VLLPVLWSLQFLAMAGVCYLLAAVAVYFRDIKDFLQLFCIAGVYAMPVFYLPAWVPEPIRPALYVNPFSYLAWCYQDACYYGRFEHPWAWLVLGVGAPVVFYAGFWAWRKLKLCFGSVL